MHRLRPAIGPTLPILLAAAWLLQGCDALGDLAGALAQAGFAETAPRPDGWESIEGKGSASRLYYQFVDERGRVHFVERLDDVPERWRASVGFVKMDVPPPLSPTDAARARQTQLARRGGTGRSSTARGEPQVVLYSADWCGACRKAKRFLAKNDVAYQERNVDDPKMAEELLRRTGRRGIPVIDVDGRIVSGFDSDAYEKLIRGT